MSMSVKQRAVKAATAFYQRRYNYYRARAKNGANKCAQRQKTTVLFTSVSRDKLEGNLACVYDRMQEQGFSDEYQLTTWLRPTIKAAQNLASQLDFIKHVAAADIIFLDDYHPFLYLIDYPKDVKIVQLWHACGSFKTIGFSREGHDSERRRKISRAHRSYTHVIVSAECDRSHYADAFNLPVERVHATGAPRIDAFLDPAGLSERKALFFERYPRARDKRVLLFAPTFRGDDVRYGGYDFSKLDLARMAQACRENNCVFVLKFHPFTKGFSGVPHEFQDVLINASGIREVNDILPAANMLITDYSSVIYEASLLDIPMVFYAYDLDVYNNDRGFYEPYEQFVPGPIVQEQNALMQVLFAENHADLAMRSRAFCEQHFAYKDRHNTDRVLGIIFPSFSSSFSVASK